MLKMFNWNRNTFIQNMRYFIVCNTPCYQKFSLEFCKGGQDNRCPTLVEFQFNYILILCKLCPKNYILIRNRKHCSYWKRNRICNELRAGCCRQSVPAASTCVNRTWKHSAFLFPGRNKGKYWVCNDLQQSMQTTNKLFHLYYFT